MVQDQIAHLRKSLMNKAMQISKSNQTKQFLDYLILNKPVEESVWNSFFFYHIPTQFEEMESFIQELFQTNEEIRLPSKMTFDKRESTYFD